MRIVRTQALGSVLFAALFAAPLAAQNPTREVVPLRDWRHPSVAEAARVLESIRPAVPQLHIVNPATLIFQTVQPCRLIDTRNPNGPFGGPIFANGETRSYDFSGPFFSACASTLPVNVLAYSLNITVVNTAGGPGFLTAFPTGSTRPLVATVNWQAAGAQVNNSVIVPSGTSDSIDIYVGISAHVIVDINGIFLNNLSDRQDSFSIISNVPGGVFGAGVVVGKNTNTNSANSWGGFFTSDSCNAGSAGVFGLADAAPSCGAIFGVWGRSVGTSSGSAGVNGENQATVNDVFGVSGSSVSGSSLAAGVYGFTNQAIGNGGRFGNSSTGTAVFLATQVGGTNYALYSGNGGVQATTLTITGAKSFIAPHLTDASKEIHYASVEAPTVDVYFRGTATLANGSAWINVPEHFRVTAREGTYMTTLTPVGKPVALSVDYEGPEGIAVRGSGSGRFHYVVYAERAEIEGFEAVRPNTHFTPEALEKGSMLQAMPAGTRAILVKNGTINADGSYNIDTARAQGWTIPQTSAASASPH